MADPLLNDQRGSINLSVHIGVRWTNILSINCEVVSSLHIDILQWGQYLGCQVSWSGLDGIRRRSSFRLTNCIKGNNSEVVVLPTCKIISSSFVDVSWDFGSFSPGCCSFHLILNGVAFNWRSTIIERFVPGQVNEGSAPVIGLRLARSPWDISLISSNERFVQRKWVWSSNSIDRHDSHKTFLLVHKTSDSAL